LPFGGDSKDSTSESNFPNADFPKSSLNKSEGEGSKPSGAEPESAEPESGKKELDEESRDDQVEDPASIEESSEAESGDDPHIAGELGPDHDDPYHDEYHHDHDDYHHEHHEEQEHQYDHDYHGHEDDHGDYGYGHGGGYGGNGDGDDDSEEEDDFGGPIKPFLDHLEDLRWTVMKCAIAVVVGMLVALMGSGYIIDALKFPLERAQTMQKVLGQNDPAKRTIPIKIGDGIIGTVHQIDLEELMRQNMFRGSATNLSEITSIRLRPSTYDLKSTNGMQILDKNGTRYPLEMFVETNGTDSIKWSLELKAFGPMKGFMIALRIGFFGGLAIAFPFLIYFIAQFVVPALRVKEKEWMLRLSLSGSLLFAIGVAFAYVVILQIALWASVGFAEMLGLQADEWQAEEYISFVCLFLIGMGIAFQLPMVLLFMVKIGLLDYKKLGDLRMYAVVANLVISAVLTPTGDPITLLLVAGPLHLLYELSIFIAWIWYRKDLANKEVEL